MTWIIAAERPDTPDATTLRRDYYGEVAGRYWHRPATEREIDEGLTDDGTGLLVPPTGAFFVGRYEGKPSGCAGLVLLNGELAELTRVFVRPEARGTGGGGLLLAAVEAAARAYGVRRIQLDTRNDLVEARGLYVKHGYREAPAHNAKQYAEHWYVKDLGPVGAPVGS
ncbi:GNAT family N-acetyltransferase [Streptomyces candidus]|uniref:GNAT superfamily N-acetyltransferase n=1 Tax=Streptomyces candidus TaxID=67283 RepID=A0A7X0HCX4_9ACTN|nr:GNAT family N-acetyltransferase [Streptomyces candidus]MBB6433957.1 GNAT superfamily N-acetyltransferase [Streptomyces candidus]GHH33879.1 N-acetyltransferase [Streptomyces candidus]